MALNFNPSDLTVKEASSRMGDMPLEDLKEALDAELAGKHRTSLLSEITRQMDLRLEAGEDEAAVVQEAAVEEEGGTKVETISAYQWNHLRVGARRLWTRASDGSGSFYKES
jgi:hypothetical protein